ncbi:DUF4143 domain-containing protein [Promicromonospora sukumoe]|uniref:AAA+ superfamily ATPase n=1 Tax=Promicromonospora sukumoe TaxID=88382 RepID=A0A7W3JD08_9MICO|nr:DUF4143 domain-containing protein [Promicromonospora sukumoe]MBA8810586.1 hypothetical protein [Promicromonospora sukumoe]
MVAYSTRVVDRLLDRYLEGLPAVALQGPKGVGKTATAQQRVQRTIDLSDQFAREAFRAAQDPLAGLDGATLIDEWQREPGSWDQVKRAVDRGAAPGSFLIAGSSTPPGATVHSGAGRILTLRMRPLSLYERGVAVDGVSLADLLDGGKPAAAGATGVDLRTYTQEILASGFPGIRRIPADLRQDQIDAYLDATVSQEFAEQGVSVRRPATLRAWMAAYAAATATTSTYTTILDAATPGLPDKPARSTTLVYRDVLTRAFLLDPLEPWMPSRNHLKRLGQTPKHYLADPALAARLLGASEKGLLAGRATGPDVPRDGTLLGALFEHLVASSVQVYAQAARARTGHLRTQDGRHEVDLIVERDGAVLALEVKLAATVTDDDVKHLVWLREQIGEDLVDAAVISTGPDAYRRRDGIAVIPAALLVP